MTDSESGTVELAPQGAAAGGWRRSFVGRSFTSFLVGTMISLTLIGLYLKKPEPLDRDIAVAERFADVLRFGSSSLPEDDKSTGYGAAFALMSEKKQEEIGASGFVQIFDDFVARFGLMQAAKRLEREGGRMDAREIIFNLSYSGNEGQSVIVEMVVTVRRISGDYRIDDFACAPQALQGK